MNQIFGDMKNVISYIDDLLITSNDDEKRLDNINEIFERIIRFGLVLNFKKNMFMQTNVRFLEHSIDVIDIS
ncbi:unnamed protein product [Gordionus sp. m RMFG-2023]